ncbi:fluoride efflux transporter CrcB [Pseudonocardia kujensis]|uniref:fluoride efflux transporter CrcB n=1 Tax=Pseudonocardia kujensis TaxID=1128675 RepID=UPI001E6083A9|nr:fluoride efflux transporter CrcB [Pseudonocardia kujensis]MCE0767488.1 fluoride efflux transporter CrcB [Pseudonocardia kujensis]
MTEELPPAGEDVVEAPPRPVMEPFRGQGRATLAVAAGGAVGAIARWAVGLGLPTLPGAFPLGTFLINVVGCAAIGALLVALTELRQAHPLLRPFLATGILGGFTTFSTFSVDSQHLLLGGHLALAVVYLAGTLVAAVAATWLGAATMRRLGR